LKINRKKDGKPNWNLVESKGKQGENWVKEGKTDRKKGGISQKPAETLSAVADTDGRKVENQLEE